MKKYTLIDPETDYNCDYNISQTKFDKLTSTEQAKYEEDDDDNEDEDF